eukprot:366496-Chlamydomonas_euryale.AAC.17
MCTASAQITARESRPSPGPPSSADAGSCRPTSRCRPGISTRGMYGGLLSSPPSRPRSVTSGSHQLPSTIRTVAATPARAALARACAAATVLRSTAHTRGSVVPLERATSASAVAIAIAPLPVPRSAQGMPASAGRASIAEAASSGMISVSGRGMSTPGDTARTWLRQCADAIKYWNGSRSCRPGTGRMRAVARHGEDACCG